MREETSIKAVWTRYRRSTLGQMSVRVARSAINSCIERYLNVGTTGPAGATGLGCHADSNLYEPLDYPFLNRCVNALALKDDDVVFDIGCGMGRALCLFARRRVRKCVGIELDQDLAARARTNLTRLRGRRSDAEVIAADAAAADYSGGTVFYIFNSFGPKTLATVLARIRTQASHGPRAVQIIYVNPVHKEVLESAEWLSYAGDLSSAWFRMRATRWTCRDEWPRESSDGGPDDSDELRGTARDATAHYALRGGTQGMEGNVGR